MSFWYAPKKEDIDVDVEDGEEVLNILLGSDNSGNIWAEMKVKDVEEKIKESRSNQQSK